MPTPTRDQEHSNAEILLWQGRYRVVFLPLVGIATIALMAAGVISARSIFVPTYPERDLLLWVAGLLVGYFAYHRLMAMYLARARRAGVGLVIAAIASDVIVLFTCIALVTPPEHYDRALVVAIFTVQLTQIFFGWSAAVANLFLVAFAYTLLTVFAAHTGAPVPIAEEMWTLALVAIGVLMYVALQGRVARRMNRLVALFSRAQEGDFSAQFEEDPEEMPDPISIIGRAYNRMRSHLETIVLTDPLSGCFNRRGLNQLAEREVSRAVRGKRDIAVLAIDVDHFKSINDRFGHMTGDEVLREIGALLRETAREPDVVARIGGEEFIILAPDSADEGALILAERVMEAFRRYHFHSLPADSLVTVSVGVAAAPARDDEIAKTLLARADEALYIAKRNGRNRAVAWHAGMRAFDGTTGARNRASVQGMLRVNE